MKHLYLATVGAAMLLTQPAGAQAPIAAAATTDPDAVVSEETDSSAMQALVQKVIAEQALAPMEQDAAPTHICRVVRRQGSRIKRNRCLTAAEWKQERVTAKIRSFLAKGAGSGRPWQPST